MRSIYRVRLALSALTCCLLMATTAFAEDRVFDKQFNAATGGTLTVNTDIGAITVSGSDGNQVIVHASIRGDRHLMEQFEITAESTGEGVTVRGRRSDAGPFDFSWMSWAFSEGLEVAYTIQVPRTYQVDVRNSRGNLELRDFNGKAHGHTSRGSVSVIGINGEVHIGTSRGSIRGSQLVGSIDLVTSRGDVTLTKVLGPVDVRTSRGDVAVDLMSPNHGARITTSRGDVVINVPKQFAADLDARSSRGEVDCDLTVTNSTRSGTRRSEVLKGEMNGGGKLLKVQTSRGDIDIQSGP